LALSTLAFSTLVFSRIAMAFSFGPPVPEQQVAYAAHFLLELISMHGQEAIRLSRSSDLTPLLLLRDEIGRRRDHLLDLAERTAEGRLRQAVLAFVHAQQAWEDLMWAGVGSHEADQLVGLVKTVGALQQELSHWGNGPSTTGHA
jgi:predicted transcriptional regulator